MKRTRIKRTRQDLMNKLLHHLELLIEVADKAFYEYRHEEYLGEVAGRLRLLVINYGQNKALLLGLMKEYEYERKFMVGFSIGTLRTFLYYPTIMTGKYFFNHEKTIRYLSQQTGSAHEDWEIDEELYDYLYSTDNATLNDSTWLFYQMKAAVNTVLREAMLFLLHLYQMGELEKFSNLNDLRRILNIGTFYPNNMAFSISSRKRRGIATKPHKELLQKYDILYLSGKASYFNVKIPGITPKEELKANGPHHNWWMDKLNSFK